MKTLQFRAIKDEPAASSSIVHRMGAPRLLVNDKEVYPLLAWSWNLASAAPIFAQAGINLLHPILGLNAAWPEPETYNWFLYDQFFAAMLAKNPNAYFLPRLHLDVPQWWKKKHPQELIKCGLPLRPTDDRQYRKVIQNPKGGYFWGIQGEEPSFASDVWKYDIEHLLRAFLRYVENSPLKSRIIGYQIGSGIYAEWHYFLAEFVPDYSEPARTKLGNIPPFKNRLATCFGLLRDPKKEKMVIDFYHRFHAFIADTVLHFARVTKEETQHRLIVGTFFCYLLENVWIQEGGHLVPEKILNSPDIDFIASPYSYQTTNLADRPWWEHDVADEAGNYLGRSRGMAGDGGYRVLLESLKRHNKLFFVEMDPSTYLESGTAKEELTGVDKEQCHVGGKGSDTVAGTMKILQRDLGQMFVSGCGGWLFDFGPVLRTRKSWYGDQPIIDQVRQFVKLGHQSIELNMSSCSQIAAVYDAKSFFITRHWRSETDFFKGGTNMDFFSFWFLDSQARAFHRIGAPVDFLYRNDLQPDDVKKYRLIFMVNLFYLSADEVATLRSILKDSGTTVVWYYAPGFVRPDSLDQKQMELLTGFQFEICTGPGPMLIESSIQCENENIELTFGVRRSCSPRFCVRGNEARSLGHWVDSDEVAFAWKEYDGWKSVYVGCAPLPIEILRWLAAFAGADLWSSKADIVRATYDTAMLVATSDGDRILSLPKPMAMIGAERSSSVHLLSLMEGNVRMFCKNVIPWSL